jgi:uncharacterized protein
MSTAPSFPEFKPIELEDRSFFAPVLEQYGPETSEWSFTNLFIWRDHYRFRWSVYNSMLIVAGIQNGGSTFALQPMGPSPRYEAVMRVLQWLKEEEKTLRPSIERADKRLADELSGRSDLTIEPTRDHYDYFYLRDDLVQLAGNKYRTKRNHINRINRTYSFTFESLEDRHLDACLELQSNWCEIKRCDEDLSLLGEWEAIRETTKNYASLGVRGGVITVGGKVEAFSIGEMLNDTTAVVHIEKANPEIAELYTVINQQCAEKCWGNVPYINREQDLGIPGLREAKLSYNPHHMVEKYRITLTGT